MAMEADEARNLIASWLSLAPSAAAAPLPPPPPLPASGVSSSFRPSSSSSYPSATAMIDARGGTVARPLASPSRAQETQRPVTAKRSAREKEDWKELQRRVRRELGEKEDDLESLSPDDQVYFDLLKKGGEVGRWILLHPCSALPRLQPNPDSFHSIENA
jgi:hypothetical protein